MANVRTDIGVLEKVSLIRVGLYLGGTYKRCNLSWAFKAGKIWLDRESILGEGSGNGTRSKIL